MYALRMEKYLIILIDSLHKKMGILDSISEVCDDQDKCLDAAPPDIDAYNDLMRKKKEYLDQLTLIDDGFVALYERIAPDLRDNVMLYAPKLRELKGLVEEVAAKTALIQAHEMRIQARIDRLVEMGVKKTSVKPGRSDVAKRYSKTMTKADHTPAIFINRKK